MVKIGTKPATGAGASLGPRSCSGAFGYYEACLTGRSRKSLGAGHIRQDKLAGNEIDGNCGSPKGEEPTPKGGLGRGEGRADGGSDGRGTYLEVSLSVAGVV